MQARSLSEIEYYVLPHIIIYDFLFKEPITEYIYFVCILFPISMLGMGGRSSKFLGMQFLFEQICCHVTISQILIMADF